MEKDDKFDSPQFRIIEKELYFKRVSSHFDNGHMNKEKNNTILQWTLHSKKWPIANRQ